MNERDIPQEWIHNYINQMLEVVKTLEPNSTMYSAILNRADIILDLVKAFRESPKG